MASLTESLVGVMKDKLFGLNPAEKESENSLSPVHLKIISKNFMSISSMARDLNVASRNVKELVKVMGGKPSEKEDKVAGSGLTEEEREKKLQVLLEEERQSLSPTKKDSDSFFDKMKKKGVEKLKKTTVGKKLTKLKDQFKENNFVKIIQKFFEITVIVGILFVAFKDSIIEWAKDLWKTVSDKFMGFVNEIKSWFDEVVTKIVDGVKEFIDNMVSKISEFFKNIGNWFVEKFEKIKEFFEPVTSFISKMWEKFTTMLDEVKAKIRPIVEGAMKWSGKDGRITKLIQNIGLDEFVGLRPKTKQISEDEDSAEKKKLKRQQQESIDKDTKEQDRTAHYRQPEPQSTAPTPAPAQKEQIPPNAVLSSDGTPVRDGSGNIVTTGEPETGAAPTPSPAPPSQAPTPSREKKDEKPLDVSGVQATIVDSLKQSGIESPKAHANVLATVKAESNFKVQSENLNYSSAERIQGVFGKRRIPTVEFAQQFVRNPEGLANHVYKTTDGNSAPGDGFKYRGRGFIQHTGKNQYAAISKFTGIDVLSNPDALNSPEVAAKAIPWFLLNYKRMKPEDVSNMSKVNKAIAFADPTGEKARQREASAENIYASMSGSGSSGTQVASASNEVASGQRQQQKPSTPNVVNAPTNNTTVVNNHKVASAPQNKDSSKTVTSMAA
jgi:putative chitinase